MLAIQNADVEAPESENSIAHEITHGYLRYALGYCIPSAEKPPASADVAKAVNIVFSMVEDIVVNQSIQKEGFEPFHASYLEMVREETDAACRRDSSIYELPGCNHWLRNKFMVLRYIVAWGYVKYCCLSPVNKKLIEEFLDEFPKAFRGQYKMASQIKEIVLKNDIFTAEGHMNTIKAILMLWKLDDCVELV